jgi:hypothetical protein
MFAMQITLTYGKRIYDLHLERDLLGDYILTRHWHGVDDNSWGRKVTLFLVEAEARKQYQKTVRARLRQGYRVSGGLYSTGLD